jgi:hypothetical protein
MGIRDFQIGEKQKKTFHGALFIINYKLVSSYSAIVFKKYCKK